jgi:3-phenylpropionate/cinnamic acid dioxygenase small subunit
MSRVGSFAACTGLALAILAVPTLTVGARAVAAARAPASVEARLQSLEDYQAIQEMLAIYMVAEDSNDWKTYSSLFAKNGELMFQKNHWVGPERIYQGMKAAQDAPNSVLARRGLRHSLSNIDIRLDGDRAHVISRWIVMSRQADGRPLVGATGYLDDNLVREDGAWKFARRVIYTEFPFDDPLANLGMKK